MKKRKAKAGMKPKSGGDWLARVSVGLKANVLDPQGKTVRSALASLGFKMVRDIRVGKHFWVVIDGKLSREKAMAKVGEMCKKVLVNPVIETYTFEMKRG
jgi:phosphoribosylformylglycinamidine synthase PurS subunit